MQADRRRGSLRWQLMTGVALVLFVSVGVSFAIIYENTSGRIEQQVAHDVAGDTSSLAASLRLIDHPALGTIVSAARRYVADQPFSSNATLLFVLIPGADPVSNYPELFDMRARADDGESFAQQRQEGRFAAALSRPQPRSFTSRLIDVGEVRLMERTVRLGALRATIGAGEPLTSVIRAQRGVIHSFLAAGAFIAIAVLLGSFLVGARVTAPLRRMAAVAARVDAGDFQPRMQTGRNDEIGVLAVSFNHMLARLDAAFAAQRAFVADASHELRTPLTVVQGQLEVLARRQSTSPEELRRVQQLVGREVQRMRRLVDDLLLLTQADQPEFLQPESIDLPRFLEQILDDASLIADRQFEIGPIPPGRLNADPDRLAQAVRNLLTNAIDHTGSHTGIVRIEATRDGPQQIEIVVLDNGPGIPASELTRVFERFHRTNTERAGNFGGAGLGLAIVRAIAHAHGGTATASNTGISSGARIELRLPGFSSG